MVPEAELPQYPLRREPQVRGQVRLVIFRDGAGVPFDVSACGGTHVPHAAMAAPVVVLRTERVRGGLTRVVFMAGEEASAYLGGVYAQLVAEQSTEFRPAIAPVEAEPVENDPPTTSSADDPVATASNVACPTPPSPQPDPRFTATAAELEKAGVKDFQLDYALKTLKRLATPPVKTAAN